MSQVKVQGNVSGTGVFTVAAPNSNTDRTLTLPDNTGTLVTNATAGTVLQVVQAAATSTVTTTSTSFVTSGFSLSITPSSASNKVLIMVNGGKCYAPSGVITCRMYRNGSAIGAAAQWSPQEGGGGGDHSCMYLDSPATTSAITYTPFFRTNTGVLVYFTDDPATWGNATITAMEIAA
jgi:hypothetical protein